MYDIAIHIYKFLFRINSIFFFFFGLRKKGIKYANIKTHSRNAEGGRVGLYQS